MFRKKTCRIQCLYRHSLSLCNFFPFIFIYHNEKLPKEGEVEIAEAALRIG